METQFPDNSVTEFQISLTSTSLPSHTLRLYNLIYTTAHPKDHLTVSIQHYFIQEIANFLYYTTFSCNFILYSLYGKHFQQNLKLLLKCSSLFEEERALSIRRLSSARIPSLRRTMAVKLDNSKHLDSHLFLQNTKHSLFQHKMHIWILYGL